MLRWRHLTKSLEINENYVLRVGGPIIAFHEGPHDGQNKAKMSQDQPGRHPAVASTSIVSEEKRRAARRRFLMRGAAGSGVVIVTLYHQRSALAKKTSIYTSSPEMCLSLKGTPSQKTTMVPDPDNPTKKIPAYECQNVPDYKVPWVPQQKK